MFKKILIFCYIAHSSFVFANTQNDTALAQEKVEQIMSVYLKKAQQISNDAKKLDTLEEELEAELEFLSLAKKEIELRTNLIKDLYVDIEDTKNLYFLEFDKYGNIKEEIKSAAEIIKERLGNNAKIVKVRLKNGSMLPLIKYEIKQNDTLKKILQKTYPYGYDPTWKEISGRIQTLVNINKNVIKMNYIYPTQKIYVPVFKDNPSLIKKLK